MAGPLTFKGFEAPNGLPGWRVLCGSAEQGTVFNPGPSSLDPLAMPWAGVALDGRRFQGKSRVKVAELIVAHNTRPAPTEAEARKALEAWLGENLTDPRAYENAPEVAGDLIGGGQTLINLLLDARSAR